MIDFKKKSIINYIYHRKYSLLTVLFLFIYVKSQLANPNNFIFNFYCLLFLYAIFSLYFIQILFRVNKTYVFYLIRTFLFVLLIFESLFGFLLNKRQISEAIIQTGGDFFIDDSLIQYRFKPNIKKERAIEIFGDKNDTLYNVTYSSDNFNRRIDDKTKFDSLKNKAAIFFGCSFTFGEGLNFNNTIPYYFMNTNTEYNCYNYGFSGYGPHLFPFFFPKYLNILNNKSVKEDSCVFIYSFIQDHLNRVYGNSTYLEYASKTPNVFTFNNKLIIKKRSRFNLLIADLINASNTLKYFKVVNSFPDTKDFNKRFADIVNYTYFESKKIKPLSKFVVGIYPEYEKCNNTLNWLKFLNKNIQVVIVKKPVDFNFKNIEKYSIPHDGHPNGKLNEYYIKVINKHLHY